jgi:hypothetical protein
MKKILVFILIIFSISTILIGCSSAKEGFKDGLESGETQYTIDIEVEFNKPYGGETHMTIVGKTDLPDGEEVLISLVSEENDYIASSKDIVKDGIYVSEPFSKHGESIPKGEYIITVETSNNSKAKQEKIVDIDY